MDFRNFNQELINYLINQRRYSLKKNVSFGSIQNIEFNTPEGTKSEFAQKAVEDFLNNMNSELSFEAKNGTYKIAIKGHSDMKVITMIAFSIPLFDWCIMTITDVKVTTDSSIH